MAGISELVIKTSESFVGLCNSRGNSKTALSASILDLSARFEQWSRNIGARQPSYASTSLEHRVRAAPKLRDLFYARLNDLNEDLDDLNATLSEATIEELHQIPQITAATSVDLKEDSNTEANIIIDITALLKAIDEDISALFKLSITARKATTRDRYARALARVPSEKVLNQQDEEEAITDLFPVLRFPQLQWLKLRLIQANNARRRFLKYSEEHAEAIAETLQADVALGSADEQTPSSTVTDKDHGDPPEESDSATISHQTTASTARGTVFEIIERTAEQSVQADAESFISYATQTLSEAVLSVPPLETASNGLAVFICPYCKIEQNIQSQTAWQRHVFLDLRAYVCTHKSCELRLFESSHAWLSHELSEHFVSRHCPYCEDHNVFVTEQDVRDHLTQMHSERFRTEQLSQLVQASITEPEQLLARQCHLCDWTTKLRTGNLSARTGEDPAVSIQRYRRHVGSHLEQIALLTITSVSQDLDSEHNSADDQSDEEIQRTRLVVNWTKTKRLSSHFGTVNSVVFSSDGRFIVSGSDDRTIRMWDVASGQQVKRLDGHEGTIECVALSKDGRLVVSGGYDNTIRLWNTATGKKLKRFDHKDVVTSVALSSDERLIVSASWDGGVRLWDVATGKEVKRLNHEDKVYCVAFSPDGRFVASGSEDHTLRLWDVATGDEVWRFEHYDPHACRGVGFSSDGQFVVSTSEDRAMRIWTAASGVLTKEFTGHTDWVRSAAFSGDGRLLASASDDSTVRIWDVAEGDQVKRLRGHQRYVRSVAFSPDGRFVASTADDKTVRLWDLDAIEEAEYIDDREYEVTTEENEDAVAAEKKKVVSKWKCDKGTGLVKWRYLTVVHSDRAETQSEYGANMNAYTGTKKALSSRVPTTSKCPKGRLASLDLHCSPFSTYSPLAPRLPIAASGWHTRPPARSSVSPVPRDPHALAALQRSTPSPAQFDDDSPPDCLRPPPCGLFDSPSIETVVCIIPGGLTALPSSPSHAPARSRETRSAPRAPSPTRYITFDMSSPALDLRRRPARPTAGKMTPSLIDSFQNMSLRKGDTFHPSSSIGSNVFWDPLEARASPQMVLRSPTCPKSLEDLLIGAGERRAVELLARVDKAVETNSKLALGAVLTEPEVLPIPTFAVHDITVEEHAVRKNRTHSHGSDSGIGSSIASDDAVPAKTMTAPPTSADQSLSGLTAVTEQRGLSKYACEQIHKHIVKPILLEENLKEFHPLIKAVPKRIGKKEIKSLRDLEKTLIFLAPDFSPSPKKFLQFCERTIRVLHTTVTTLHESDQRAPSDRPYTQGYFFDLVEQIRRYAAVLAATREKQEKGEKLDEMDYSPDESVSLLGGVSHNGKPAELVRHKDGKAISLATDQVLSSEELASASMKRSMSDSIDVDEDEVLRSMARRKKNAKPEIHECSLCDKEFKRPCDLTKHLKTHERPWKCPDEKCKYHEHGWPTEKERDRHVNDKHSNTPALYHCLFPPCPYTSKRESNCKQHMEKAHGWDYIRSKNNGKGRASVTRLPKGSIPPSPASGCAVLTPLTPIAPSPLQSWATASASGSSSRHDSMPPPAGPSGFGTPAFTHPSPDFVDHFNMNFDFNNMATGWPITPAMSEERRHSCDTMSSNSGLQLDGSAFDEGVSPDDLTYGFNFNDYHFGPQVTPDSNAAGPSGSVHSMPHISPGALDQPLYDAMNVDGGNYNGDFTLFGDTQPPTTGGEMFPSLASWGNFGGQYDNSHAPLQAGNSTLDDLFPELRGH